MLNKLLQVRQRYLRAKRDLEYEKLKEKDRLDKQCADFMAKISEKPTAAEIAEFNGLSCPNCKKEFSTKAGVSSHLRHKTCEEK